MTFFSGFILGAGIVAILSLIIDWIAMKFTKSDCWFCKKSKNDLVLRNHLLGVALKKVHSCNVDGCPVCVIIECNTKLSITNLLLFINAINNHSIYSHDD